MLAFANKDVDFLVAWFITCTCQFAWIPLVNTGKRLLQQIWRGRERDFVVQNCLLVSFTRCLALRWKEVHAVSVRIPAHLKFRQFFSCCQLSQSSPIPKRFSSELPDPVLPEITKEVERVVPGQPRTPEKAFPPNEERQICFPKQENADKCTPALRHVIAIGPGRNGRPAQK